MPPANSRHNHRILFFLLLLLPAIAPAALRNAITDVAHIPSESELSQRKPEGAKLQPPEIKVLDLPENPARVLKLDLVRDANDVWDRIRRGFGIPNVSSTTVTEIQAFYLSHPAFLQKVMKRGGQYLYFIVNEIEQRGMPTELALLPMIESSYNPLATSPSNAAGLWQFIPSTGRVFKLTQNNWIDERRDIIASTNAALDYLEHIYELYGDWHLAIISYNYGEGAMGRAIKNNEKAGLPISFDSLQLSMQAKRYLPKLQAIKNIIAQPELFGLDLPYIPNDPHFTVIRISKDLTLAEAAKMADMSLEDFISLNPSFKQPSRLPEGTSLIVPKESSELFRERLLNQDGQSKVKLLSSASSKKAPQPQ